MMKARSSPQHIHASNAYALNSPEACAGAAIAALLALDAAMLMNDDSMPSIAARHVGDDRILVTLPGAMRFLPLEEAGWLLQQLQTALRSAENADPAGE